MSFVNDLLRNSVLDTPIKQDALNRAWADPGIPTSVNATSTFWLREPHHEVSNCQSKSLTQTAHTVIIGSGITGTSVAKTLLECSTSHAIGSSPTLPPQVVMLDARDICSGATGRNGGHILETAEEYADLKEIYGKAEAICIMKFRLAHLQTILDIAQELELTEKSQTRRVRFLSVYFDEKLWNIAEQNLLEFQKDLPTESIEWNTINAKALTEDFHLPRAVGAISGPGGTIWPYKFVTSVLAQLKSRFRLKFLIESNTPVTSVSGSDGCYEVVTSRGTIKFKHVVHCTNAHVGHLIPKLRGNIYPIRGQMSAQEYQSKLPNQGRKHSWVFNYCNGFDYLTQLPADNASSDGEFMLGGGFASTEGNGISEIGIASDTDINGDAKIHLNQVLGATFSSNDWKETTTSKVKAMWTGSMGFSADMLPWVGKLPPSLTENEWCSTDNVIRKEQTGSEWVAAGFSGEGMVNCWLSGQALAVMLLDHDGDVKDNRFIRRLPRVPEPMLISKHRILNSVIPRYVREAQLI